MHPSLPSDRQSECVGAGEPPAAHVAGSLALVVVEAVLAAVARAVLGHQRHVLVLAVVLLPGGCNSSYKALYPGIGKEASEANLLQA